METVTPNGREEAAISIGKCEPRFTNFENIFYILVLSRGEYMKYS